MRYRAREAWRAAWDVAAVRSRDEVLGIDVVLVRSESLVADLPSLQLPEELDRIAVLGIVPDAGSTWLVERDVGQRLLPERLATVDALHVLAELASVDAALRTHGLDALEFGLDAARVLPDGAVALVPAAGRRTSDVVLDRAPGADAATRTIRRLAAQLADAVRTAGDDTAPLDRIVEEATAGGGAAWLRDCCARELAAVGVDARLRARRLVEAAIAAEAATHVPVVDAHPSIESDPLERWDEQQLEVRTWHGVLRGRVLLAAPLVLLLAVLAASIVVADGRDDRAGRVAAPVEQVRTIAASTGAQQQAVTDALESWNGDAAGIERLRAAGRALGDAARDGAEDASQLQLTSVSEAEAHGALVGMLAGQEALADVLVRLPTASSKIEAAAFQDALLRSRVVLSDFIALRVALGALGQQPISEEGYGALPDAAEHGLDVAIEAEADRFAGSREREQQRLQRALQERLLEAMEAEQRRGLERLEAAQARAGEGLGDVQGEVLDRMSAAWETRFEEFSSRAARLERDSTRLRTSGTIACDARAQAALQTSILARQQLVLEINTTAAPTEDGLRRQVALVTSLGTGVRRDQLALERVRATRATDTVADVDSAVPDAQEPAACT